MGPPNLLKTFPWRFSKEVLLLNRGFLEIFSINRLPEFVINFLTTVCHRPLLHSGRSQVSMRS
jgi:hypothetical protein